MLEVAQGVFGSDRIERLAYRFYQSLFASGRGFAQQVLNLAERLLYGIVIGGVGRQIEQLAALLLYQLPNPLRLVGREVVHYYDLSRTQARHKHLLDIGLEEQGVGRLFYGQRRPHPVSGYTRK